MGQTKLQRDKRDCINSENFGTIISFSFQRYKQRHIGSIDLMNFHTRKKSETGQDECNGSERCKRSHFRVKCI